VKRKRGAEWAGGVAVHLSCAEPDWGAAPWSWLQKLPLFPSLLCGFMERHCHFASALKYLPQAIQFLSPAMGVYLSKFRHFDFNVAISPWKGFLLVSKVNPISLICNSEMQKNP
jgi:hypothetical protein